MDCSSLGLCRLCRTRVVDTFKESFVQVHGKIVCLECVGRLKSGDYTVKPVEADLELSSGSYFEEEDLGDQKVACVARKRYPESPCDSCGNEFCNALCMEITGRRLYTKAHMVRCLLKHSSAKTKKPNLVKELLRELDSLVKGSGYQQLNSIQCSISEIYACLQIIDTSLAYLTYNKAYGLLLTGSPCDLPPLCTDYLHWFEWGKSHLHLKNLVSKINTTLHLKGYKVPFYSRSVTLPDGSILITGGRYTTEDFSIAEAVLVEYRDSEVLITHMPPMINERSNHALIYLNDSVYAIGGNNGSNTFFDGVERFDLGSQTWHECSSTPYISDSISAIADQTNNSIYIVGGRVSNGVLLGSISRYDIMDDEWTELRLNLTTELDTCGLAFLPGSVSNLIVFGGQNSQNEAVNDVHLVDFQRNTVAVLANMAGTGGCFVNESKAYDGYLYVLPFFGFETRSYERLSFETFEWEVLS